MKSRVLGALALLFSNSQSCALAHMVPDSAGNYPNKNTRDASVYRGNIVFNHYCVLCHGINGDGQGRAAKLYQPTPANLIISDKNDQYQELIIRRGGAALQRSKSMPPWGEELSDEQIADVVSFLQALKNKLR